MRAHSLLERRRVTASWSPRYCLTRQAFSAVWVRIGNLCSHQTHILIIKLQYEQDLEIGPGTHADTSTPNTFPSSSSSSVLSSNLTGQIINQSQSGHIIMIAK